MQLPNIEEMSSEEKKWFAYSIAGMVVADGRAHQSEMKFLREAIHQPHSPKEGMLYL